MTNPVVGTLVTDVTNARGAMSSATVLLNGFQTRLDAAVAAALANGASAAELQPLTDLSAAFEADTTALAAAVAANPAP
jgi:hypothetical protein